MDQIFNPWASSLPVAELTMFRDWDYSNSQYLALRYYWQQFGTIPHWSLALCGGTPVMSNPNSPGFAPHSLLAYIFSPTWAYMAEWVIVLSLAMFCIFRLFKRWEINSWGAVTGITLLFFNGFYGSHFNQGHHGFVLFLLVPVLMSLFDVALSAIERNRSYFWPALGITLLTWVMFTGAPHTLFHFYPALFLFLILRFFHLKRRTGWLKALCWHVPLITAHILGIVISFYKLGAIMAWQMNHPRSGVIAERLTLLDVFETTQRFVTDYFDLVQYFPSQFWSYWEYNNYVGPMPVLLVIYACGALMVALYGRLRHREGYPSFSYGVVLGALLIVSGVLMTLGNDHPLSPARFLRYFPFVNGIRVFGRYQIMTLFGIVTLVGYALTLLERHIDKIKIDRRLIMAIKAAIFLAVCLPAAAQAAVLMWNVKAMSNRVLVEDLYKLRPQPGNQPLMIKPARTGDWSTQAILVENNVFPAQCYEQLTSYYVNLENFPVGFTYSLTSEARARLTDVTTNSFGLSFPDDLTGEVRLNIIIPPEFKTNIEGRRAPNGQLAFDAEQLRGKTLVVDTTLLAEVRSAQVALGGALGALLFFAYIAIKSWRCRHEGISP